MNSEGNEVLLNEGCELGISVRFGFQPSASTSSRSGAEVYEHRFVFRFGSVQTGINVFDPMNCHKTLLSQLIKQQPNWMQMGN